MIGSTCLEHGEIGVHCAGFIAENAVSERLGRGDRGRVLVDVVVAVEMRDVGPFDRDQIVDLQHALAVAVIAAQDVTVDLAELVAGEGVSFFNLLVDCELELCEHRLAEIRGAQVLQRRPKVVQLLRIAGRDLEHMVEQKGLVER